MTSAPTPPARSAERVLLATADPMLREELTRLAAAAGATPLHVDDVGAALPSWHRAALVLIGADLLPQVALADPPRRSGVYAVSWGPPGEEVYRPALRVGTEAVLELPESSGVMTELLTDLGEETADDSAVIGAVGGSGGAGATTFAAAVAQVGAAQCPTILIDADPLGPGADSVLGLEETPGVRWSQLAASSGRLSARSLRQALPRSGNLSLLSWDHGDVRDPVDAGVAREVLSAARRGHQLVVLDLPRRPDPASKELMARCDLVLLVVRGTVAGVASATRVVANLPDRERVRVVVRGEPPESDAVGRALGLPVLTAMADQRGLAESIDLGLGPVRSRRGPLGRAVREVLQRGYVHQEAA